MYLGQIFDEDVDYIPIGQPVQIVPGPVAGPFLPPPSGAFGLPEFGAFDTIYTLPFEAPERNGYGGVMQDTSFPIGTHTVTERNMGPRNRAQFASPSLYTVDPRLAESEVLETGQTYFVDYLDGVGSRWPVRVRG